MNPIDTEGFKLMLENDEHILIKEAIERGYYKLFCDKIKDEDIVKYILRIRYINTNWGGTMKKTKINHDINTYNVDRFLQYKPNIINCDKFLSFIKYTGVIYTLNPDEYGNQILINLLLKYSIKLNYEIINIIIIHRIEHPLESANPDNNWLFNVDKQLILSLNYNITTAPVQTAIIIDKLNKIRYQRDYLSKLCYEQTKQYIDQLYDLITLGIDGYEQKYAELNQEELRKKEELKQEKLRKKEELKPEELRKKEELRLKAEQEKAEKALLQAEEMKKFAIKDQLSLKHEILINKDMSKIINVIKSRYYDLLFELIELININTYIYDNEVYKTILILAVENYAKDKQFDKMLILYLLKTANPNLCAYRQGIVEKIYDFNYTPVQLMIKHEDFDLILAMIEKGAILNLTKHFVTTKGLGFGVDFEMYLKLNIINVIIKCPLLTIKDDRIKDLLMANNCCGERSLLLDANV